MAANNQNLGELLPIEENNGRRAVNARLLHGFLGSKQQFTDWINNRIKKYGFVENKDYQVFRNFMKNPEGGRPSDEYALSIGMAKELSMVENTARGREARQYFIACEEKANSSQIQLSDAEIILKMAQMNVENERRMKALELELKEIKERTTTDIGRSTVVAYVTRHNISLDVKKYGAMGRKASTLCKKRNLPTGKVNDPRWGTVSVYPDDVLDEIFRGLK